MYSLAIAGLYDLRQAETLSARVITPACQALRCYAIDDITERGYIAAELRDKVSRHRDGCRDGSRLWIVYMEGEAAHTIKPPVILQFLRRDLI